MQRRTRRMIGVVALIGALAAGGAAFTAANTVPASVAGYGSAVVSGATATALKYTLSTDSKTITSAIMTLTGDQTNNTVVAGVNGGATNWTCAITTAYAGVSTGETCTPPAPVTTSTVTEFDVAVTNTN